MGYSLNLIPRYTPEDYQADDRLSNTIGSVIQQYIAKQDAERNERNTIAQEGGSAIGPPPETPMDRLRHAGSAIKSGFNRVFRPGQYQQDRADEAGQIADQGMQHLGVQMTPNAAGGVGQRTPGAPPIMGTTGPIYPGQPHPGHQPFDEDPRDFGMGGGRGYGIGSAIELATGGLPSTYDIESSTGQRYRIPRQPNPQIVQEILRNEGEDIRASEARGSAERIARTRAQGTVEAARVRSTTPRPPAQESPSLARSRNAAADRNEAELGDLQTRQRNADADRLVQALQAQNPGRAVTPEALAQYAGGLYRNGRISRLPSNEELYGALDRYHNPPNRAPTTSGVMAQELQRQLGEQGRVAPPVSTTTPGAGRGGAPTQSRPPADVRYDQLRQSGLPRDSILARMRREGYPPPG